MHNQCSGFHAKYKVMIPQKYANAIENTRIAKPEPIFQVLATPGQRKI